jgi:miniconductance mechanosensitive channel
MKDLRELLASQLSIGDLKVGIDHWGVASIELIAYSIFAYIIYYAVKQSFITKVRGKIKESKWNFGNYLIKHNLFTRVIALLPLAIISSLSENILNKTVVDSGGLITSTLMVIFTVALLYSFLDAAVDICSNKGLKKLPLKPISQLLKILITVFGFIIFYSNLINESATSILTGLGALSAVSMLVFKESLQSFVASIQISLYNVVQKGDWIEIKSLGVDGDVEEINLNIITVKNFDNTITTIPTHSLMSTSFKNYRAMYTAGRRIKRSIKLDVNSFRHLEDLDIERLKKIEVIKDYLIEKENLLKSENTIGNESDSEFKSINGRALTNIGTFRKYIYYYLQNHPEISKDNTLLVRQLENQGEGLPVELYCFTSNSAWVHNEEVKADIFDHLFTIANLFGLDIYQKPTGSDFRYISS